MIAWFRLSWWFTNLLLRAKLSLCDRIAGPLPETDADRIRERMEGWRDKP